MLYILHGGDFKKRGGKLNELIAFSLGKKPNTAFLKVGADNFGSYDLDELSLGQGLFEQKCVVVLDGLFGDAEAREVLLKKLPELADSKNVFVVNERTLGKGDLSALKTHAEKTQDFLEEEKFVKTDFNIFSLADAVGGRDKKRAWTLYLRALSRGFEPEEIHGTIFWQVKNMLLVKGARNPTAETTGLKPFVLSKAKLSCENYSKEELRKFSSHLVSLYHDSHRGLGDFSVGLEKLLLETL